ncbi:hypothetical protein [Maricaulis sp.]|uniref:hypothetical protein n=1 Tax=Maricaulis sp. TaxID=1486257 RepID=UPI003A929309|tara:strand:- start:131 stop:532 length:402 start_codon:yes stop_codon:yes gene_type:complete
MSKSVTSSFRRTSDHFEPDLVQDPGEQRKLRGHLEQIDYTVSAANQAVIQKDIHHVTLEDFRNLALTAAKARTAWVSTAIELAKLHKALEPEQLAKLSHLRGVYDELSEAYEAMRRMVERGYLSYHKGLPEKG